MVQAALTKNLGLPTDFCIKNLMVDYSTIVLTEELAVSKTYPGDRFTQWVLSKIDPGLVLRGPRYLYREAGMT